MGMDTYVIAGSDGAGKTATALNLTAALRKTGVHAAVLDIDSQGNVTSTLDINSKTTLADVINGDARAGEAVFDLKLSRDDIPERDLATYYESVAADHAEFRPGNEHGTSERPSNGPDPSVLPVIAGFPNRAAHINVDPDVLAATLKSFAMAYDILVVDTGNGRVSQSPTLSVADGVLTVTTPDSKKMAVIQEDVQACTDMRTALLGNVTNRASKNAGDSEVTDVLGMEDLAVIPDDPRTAALEPVFHTVPESPAAEAYGHLASEVHLWDGHSAVTGQGATDGRNNTETEEDTDETESRGFLSRLFGDD
jgi:cellulose biosynthesis protein BcsQ